MMASDTEVRERPGRKLTMKRPEPRRVSLDMPEHFRGGEDENEDVTAPKNKDGISMNQPFLAMIARAGRQSQVDLSGMPEEDSEDTDDGGKQQPPYHGLDGASRLSRISKSNIFQLPSSLYEVSTSSRRRRRLSDDKTLHSLRKVKMVGRKAPNTDAQATQDMSSSQILTRFEPKEEPEQRQQGKTYSNLEIKRPSNDETAAERSRPSYRRSRHSNSTIICKGDGSATLAQRLQQIFEFETLEEVISDYPCWLLQSILLQGNMYITQKHICFHAYIPKRHHDVSKTGYLSKRGRSKYNKYWFVLRGDVLAYYLNPEEVYFPRHRIDLRFAKSAEVLEGKDKKKEDAVFTVTTDGRIYQFKADSAASAKEWVRSIQKVIFRTHNDGNTVKISLPIKNVIEVEESAILDFTGTTLKVRVIDNDETYAIDEYFFSFFSHGQDALNVLRIMINDNDHHNGTPEGRENESTTPAALNVPTVASSSTSTDARPQINENVRATLLPLPGSYVERASLGAESGRSSVSSSRRSLEVRRSTSASRSPRRSGREPKRSYSKNRQDEGLHIREDTSAPSVKELDMSASPSNSYDRNTESSAAVQSIEESNVSASQILSGSEVFRAPVPTSPTTPMGEHSASKQQKEARQGSDSSRHNLRDPPPLTGRADNQGPATLLSGSSSALTNIAAYPLQKASGLAGFLRTRSKRVSGLLASESMGYYEKVSGMLAGGRKHYHTVDALEADDRTHDLEDDEDAAKAAEHFREHFALGEGEQLQSSFFASLQRVLPNYGKIYISNRYFCFRSLMPTSKTKIILPMRDIENVNKEKGFRFGYHGLAILIRGHEELFFEFSKAEYRDECAVAMLRILESTKYIEDGGASSSGTDSDDEAAKAEHELLQKARQDVEPVASPDIPEIIGADQSRIPLIFDDPHASIVDFKPSEPLTIVCLTIGSRGDVQPYIALCKELIKEGHKPRIATHAEFEPWVRKHGIDFAPVEGDPAELMRICVEHGMFTLSFMREAHTKFRGWLDELISSAWKACQGADVLIESPSAMAGIHIAEALGIPYFRAFTMPWTQTRAYPHAFSVTEKKMGGHYNNITYITFDTVFWTSVSGQINSWRRKELRLKSTSKSKMRADLRPFLYNFSPSVVPPPLDWPDWIRVTGYWFLDEGDDYEPPEDLKAFIEKARKDGKKLVYVGFGSIVIENPTALTRTVVEAVKRADVRCVLSKGWSDRLEKKDRFKPEVELPPEIFPIKAAPHDWLFRQMDAAVHHGGSGTTGASLRAGIPTIVKPFFGDQYFFASRVEDLGVGIWLKKINISVFTRALWEVSHNQRMIVKARVLGQKIRKENGTQVAIQTIYRELDRAKSLVQQHAKRDADTDDFDDEWTMIDEDIEMDLSQTFHLQEPVTGMSQAPTDASHIGGSSLLLGTMAIKGVSALAHDSDMDKGA